jgi:hypothetical protein
MVNNSSDKMTHNTLAENYATRLVDDMDMDTLVTMAIETLHQQFYTEYTLEQLKDQIFDQHGGCYDDLLEQEQQ